MDKSTYSITCYIMRLQSYEKKLKFSLELYFANIASSGLIFSIYATTLVELFYSCTRSRMITKPYFSANIRPNNNCQLYWRLITFGPKGFSH